jgi:MscS family membrane protein
MNIDSTMRSPREPKYRIQAVSIHRRPSHVSRIVPLLLGGLLLCATASKALAGYPHPLAPPDRSSPRATLQSFVEQMNAAYRAYTSGADSVDVARAFRRAIDCLDLRDVAPTLHFDVGGYSALLLKEILDRVDLPSSEAIPGENTELDRWTIPQTEIAIVRMKEGELSGQYLFSQRTVERLKEFYDHARQLPYRHGANEGLLDIYLENPGGLVPSHWAEELPGWSLIRVFNRPIWKWLALFAFLVVSVVIVRGVRRLGEYWDHRFGERLAYLRFGTLSIAITLVFLAWALDVYVDDVIGLRGEAEAFIKRGALVLAFAFAVFCVYAIFELIASAMIASTRRPEGSANAHLTRLLVRIVGIAVVVFVVVEASAYLGWAVAPVVAGLGVGGIAVALAARPTIENVIGGLTLFADKPFRVGDLCRLGEDIGHIEEIGLRSTRIRTLERSLVSIPNADLAVMKIDNLGRRDMRLLHTTLGLRYETTPDQMRWVLAKIREMLLAHPMTSPDGMRTRFTGYGAYSLDVEVYVYLRCQTQRSFRAISEDLLLRILDIVKESGSGFAFPSQVNYLNRDTGLDADQRAAKENEVEQWRRHGRLPFPEFEEEQEDALRDTLDYPPRGSSQRKGQD